MAQIRDLIDQSEEAKTREQLEFLLVAAKGKLALFESELNNMFLNPESQSKIQIVGERAAEMYKEYRADLSTGVDEKITGMVDEFFTGTQDSVKNGFATLIKTGLKSILGSETAGEQQQEYFTVIPIGLVFIRVDVKVWRYNFSSSGIISTAKNAFCFLMAKSVVDYKKLTPAEMVYFIQQSVGSDDREKLKEYIEQIKEIYELLPDDTSGDQSALAGPLHTKMFERGN